MERIRSLSQETLFIQLCGGGCTNCTKLHGAVHPPLPILVRTPTATDRWKPGKEGRLSSLSPRRASGAEEEGSLPPHTRLRGGVYGPTAVFDTTTERAAAVALLAALEPGPDLEPRRLHF